MLGRLKVGRILLVLATSLVAACPSAAQQKPSRGQIFLVARMPETITLAVNGDVAKGIAATKLAFDSSEVPAVATSVTASWVLACGRSQIVTWSHVKQPPAPVIVALAVPRGASPFGEASTDIPLGYSFSPRTTISSRKLDALNITDSNRAAASTVSLSDSIATAPEAQVQDDGYKGTIKIQVQAVP